MRKDGAEEIKTFTSVVGISGDSGDSSADGRRKLPAKYRTFESGVVFALDTVFVVLFQFFLWAFDCVVLCIYLENGTSKSQLESVDDDACTNQRCVFVKALFGASVYDSTARMDMGAVCDSREIGGA